MCEILNPFHDKAFYSPMGLDVCMLFIWPAVSSGETLSLLLSMFSTLAASISTDLF